MPEETRSEAVELIVTACEKFAANNEVSVFQINYKFKNTEFLGCGKNDKGRNG